MSMSFFGAAGEVLWIEIIVRNDFCVCFHCRIAIRPVNSTSRPLTYVSARTLSAFDLP